MADATRDTDGPSPFAAEAYDSSLLPDFDTQFVSQADLDEFAHALAAPDPLADDAATASAAAPQSAFITALNDWRPVHQRVRGRRKPGAARRRPPKRGRDETREGFVYTLLKWPLLIVVFAWIIVLGAEYLATRLYIWFYERFVTWRGRRQRLRAKLDSTVSYADWVAAAQELDEYLGNEEWKETDEYAYYDSGTVRRLNAQMRQTRLRAEAAEGKGGADEASGGQRPIDELRALVEACVKNNFVGVENPRLYSQTYYGTKHQVQSFVDEAEASLALLLRSRRLSTEDKRVTFKHIHTNFGRTALCLSGGASFAYYHFGVAKALLDADLLPEVITGTSGGALIATLVATRTDAELKRLLVPALAGKITACHDDMLTWLARLYRTGARFDSLDWARRCSWFSRGSMTFREAYERTGRILNVTCVPSDPHSPTILANYLTSPDCVIWSAVLASAAVPGILNPVVLMTKRRDGTLAPFSFGHKWKDGSLRTDIPLKALNLYFNVNFSVVSQCNPHISVFFFSSRGSVGRPVTHRRGRGWRGGFLGSAVEQYLKLDLNKWLKVLRHLELLPRPLGQDWSEIWLQRFSGTITIWPRTVPSDFYYILSDPTPPRLARMLHEGQHSTFPNLKFIANRMRVERLVEEGRRATRPLSRTKDDIRSILSEENLQGLLREVRRNEARTPSPLKLSTQRPPSDGPLTAKPATPSLGERFGGWWQSLQSPTANPLAAGERHSVDTTRPSLAEIVNGDAGGGRHVRRGSSGVMTELGRQSRVFFDDSEVDETEAEASAGSAGEDEDQLDAGLGADEGRWGDDGAMEVVLEQNGTNGTSVQNGEKRRQELDLCSDTSSL
ncbi:MAG: hypothetical protein M1832_002214 [Thelocarpon impressellum]|nr:MAG: hypothetical protein M1832_002214 [Thelocarpon impressellum]